jgi:predicted permease
LPCLLFSRIVPAFTPQNISSLAPLTVVGLLYGVAGAAMAWTIKQFFWVPHRFRYGIIAAGGWGNYGDIRMSRPTVPHWQIALPKTFFFGA